MREQIADYLAQGYTQKQVAEIVGVSEPTISEYLKDDGFKEILKEKMVFYQDKRINTKYANLEEKTLNALGSKAADGFLEVSDLVRILDAVSRNKHKGLPTGNLTHPTVGITLVINQHQQPNVVLDGKNQVVEIDGQSMKSMPVNSVKELFHTLEVEKKERDKLATEDANEHERAAA